MNRNIIPMYVNIYSHIAVIIDEKDCFFFLQCANFYIKNNVCIHELTKK